MPLSLLIALLQGCEGVLRRSGQQRSGDQLHGLLTAFLARQRQHQGRIGEGPSGLAPPAPPAHELPKRAQQRRPRRVVPGLGLLRETT